MAACDTFSATEYLRMSANPIPASLRASAGNIHAIGVEQRYLDVRIAGKVLDEDDPPFEEHYDVLYMPRWGCLYDRDGKLIEASLVDFSERRDRLRKLIPAPLQDPRIINQPAEIGPTVIFGGPLKPHWGHFLTDYVARLWYHFKHRPDLPVIYGVSQLPVSGWIQRLLDLSGLDATKRIITADPVRLKHVIVPYPTFQPYSRTYRAHELFFERVLNRVRENGRPEAPPDRIYISRSKLDPSLRQVVGEAEFEDQLEKRGYHIVHPQERTVEEQVEMFSSSARVVGPIGSAMHSLLFCFEPSKRVGTLTIRPANQRSFMIDSLKSYESYYLCCMKNHETWTEPGAPTMQNQIIEPERALKVMEEANLF